MTTPSHASRPRSPGPGGVTVVGPLRGEAGAASGVELVIAVSAMMLFVFSVVAGGRMVDSRGQVNDAAYAAARAASLALGAPLDAARSAAGGALTERGRACTTLSVSLAGSDLAPGGQVKATVRCTADLGDVTGFGIPGARTFTGIAVVPIEQYRRAP